MDERNFTPQEVTKAMNMCYRNPDWDVEPCEQCPYEKYYFNCTRYLTMDAARLLNETFGGGDTDGD